MLRERVDLKPLSEAHAYLQFNSTPPLRNLVVGDNR